jgi:MFS family permease
VSLSMSSRSDIAAVQRRTLAVVVTSQVLAGAGLAAGVTVGALIAAQMLGGAAASGLPAALFTVGSALAAYLVSRSTQRRGRRVGLATGFAAGGIGAIGVVVAASAGAAVLLLVSLFVYGAGSATNLQARYAGADLAAAGARGRAISIALVSTTAGAVAGPNLAAPLGGVATSLGLPALTGPFLLAAVAYLSAGLVLAVFLRPDPYLLARRLDRPSPTIPAPGSRDGGAVRRPVLLAGAAVMVVTQVGMVAIMTMTPVHMREHDLPLSAIGVVIGIHIGAMYLPSPLTGLLVDRVGRLPIAVASALTLLTAALIAGFSPSDSVPLLVLALALLGLGWNLGLVSGTALVVDATPPADRARTQGTIDVLIALGGAGGAASAGMVMAAGGYEAVALAGGILALLLVVPLGLALRRANPNRDLVGEA